MPSCALIVCTTLYCTTDWESLTKHDRYVVHRDHCSGIQTWRATNITSFRWHTAMLFFWSTICYYHRGWLNKTTSASSDGLFSTYMYIVSSQYSIAMALPSSQLTNIYMIVASGHFQASWHIMICIKDSRSLFSHPHEHILHNTPTNRPPMIRHIICVKYLQVGMPRQWYDQKHNENGEIQLIWYTHNITLNSITWHEDRVSHDSTISGENIKYMGNTDHT